MLQGRVKAQADGTPAYDPFEKFTFKPDWIDDYYVNFNGPKQLWEDNKSFNDNDCYAYQRWFGGSLSLRWENKTFNYLKTGTYQMLEGGELLSTLSDNEMIEETPLVFSLDGRLISTGLSQEPISEGSDEQRNGFYKFSTDFVDIKDYQNLSFTVRDETEVTLKVYAVFKEANNSNAPLLVYTNEYVIDDGAETDGINSPYPFIDDQITNVIDYEGNNELTTISNTTISNGSYQNGTVIVTNNVQINPDLDIDITANNGIVFQNNTIITGNNNATFTANIELSDNVVQNASLQLKDVAQYYKDGEPYDNHQDCDCEEETNFDNPDFRSMEFENDSSDENEDESYKVDFLSISPNPFTDAITIDYIGDLGDVSTLEVFSINGTLIYSKEIASGYQSIDLSFLNSGVYFVKISGLGKVHTEKIVKR